jgi:hypothetical protein
MLVINGKDVIGEIDGVPIFCGTDCSFLEEKEVIHASTVTSNGWTEFRLRKRSWKFDVTGLTKIDSSDGQVSYFDLITSTEAVALDNVTITFTDGDGNAVEITGSMYKPESSITGPVDQSAKANVQFIGFGEYILTRL